MKTTANKNGGALILVMVIVVAIGILTAGMMKLHEVDAVEAVYVEQTDQAFWLAESGLQRALHRLRRNNTYRLNPTSFVQTIGAGINEVGVSQPASFPADTWSIVSTGTVQGVSRIIVLDPLLTAEVGYALMALDGDSKLDKNGTINSNVYSYGKITVNGRASPSVNGEIQALDTRNLDYTPLTENDRVEMKITPPLLSSDFATITGISPNYIDVPDGLGGTNTYLELPSNTVVKVDSDYDFEISPGVYAEGTYGEGTLIVDGNLTFKNTGDPFLIGDAGTVYVNGDIWAGKDGTFGENVLMYSTGDMSLQKAAGSGSTTLLVEGDLTVNKELDFNGLIFVDGYVTVDGDLTLNGSLIAGDGFWLKAGYDVTYDQSEIPDDILQNMIVYVTYSASPGTWNEVPAF